MALCYRREDSKERGRHLVANTNLDKGRLLFCERPLLALQSLDNQRYVSVCHCCKAFVGGPDYALRRRFHPYQSQEQEQQTDGGDDATTASTTDGEVSSCRIVPCRCHCGFVYCSVECEEDAWNGFHQYLCTGRCQDEHHPLVQFKRYALETNEILLLVAEWWVAQHLQEQKQQQQEEQQQFQQRHPQDMDDGKSFSSNNLNNNIGSDQIAAEEISNQMIVNNTNKNKYKDFVMTPWWDVVKLDPQFMGNHHIEGEGQEEEEKQCNSNGESLIGNTTATSITTNSSLMELQQSLHEICQTAAELLQRAWSSLPPPTSSSSSTQETPSSLFYSIPPITALDIAQRIGACEQNAMGIRQGHVLCRSILEADETLLERRKDEIVSCLMEAGFIGDEEDDDDDDDEQETEEDMEENQAINETGSRSSCEAPSGTEELVKSALLEDGITEARINHNSTTRVAKDNSELNDQTLESAEKGEQHDYSVDDIASFLANELFIDEDGTVRDEAITGCRGATAVGESATTCSLAPAAVRVGERDAVGDDLDYMFVPLDGTAMYSIACKMNHSCEPNVVILYKPSKGWGTNHPLTVHCVALRDIAANEELTISYIDAANLSYEQRQAGLANYGFRCRCTKCMREEPKQKLQQTKEGGANSMELQGRDGSSERQQCEAEQEEPHGDRLGEEEDDNTYEHEEEKKNAVYDDPFGEEEDGEHEEEKEVVADTQQTQDHGDATASGVGIAHLQKRVERLDSVSNHSKFGAVPTVFQARVSAFVVQRVGEVSHHHNSNGNDDCDPLRVQRNLLTKCAQQGIVHNDFAMCRVVGCDLEQVLFTDLVQRGSWTWPWQRTAYWCACLTAATGLSHECRFLEAMQFLDKAMIMTLERSNDQLKGFIAYVEQHANEMTRGPYSSNTQSMEEYGNDDNVPAVQDLLAASSPASKDRQCEEVDCSIIGPTSSLPHFEQDYVRASKPLVLRNYAKDWPACRKWHDMQFLSGTRGHRLVPVELGSMMLQTSTRTAIGGSTTMMKEQVMKLRSLADQYLVPSSRKRFWSLADATSKD